MLTLKISANAGANLRETMMEMVALAQRVQIRVELQANDTIFWVDPSDNNATVVLAYQRLYPDSRYVASWIPYPVSRQIAGRA